MDEWRCYTAPCLSGFGTAVPDYVPDCVVLDFNLLGFGPAERYEALLSLFYSHNVFVALWIFSGSVSFFVFVGLSLGV